jgi:uncharacterized protein GlcG (DUF336 family)
MKQLFIYSAALLLALSPLARADQFLTTVNLTVYQAVNGKVVISHQTTAALITAAAVAASEDPRTLAMVYDTDADAVEVVRRSDGSVVSPQLQFTGGLTVANAADTSEERQAFIMFQGSGDVTGSVTGKITKLYDGEHILKHLTWVGSVQLSEPATGVTPDVVIKGAFGTGAKFVPKVVIH